MHDSDCMNFLQWSLPRMGMRWRGFRKVRAQVCKRLQRRLEELGIDGLDAYRSLLEQDRGEWERLRFLCRVTISSFYRDRAVFDALRSHVLPALAASAAENGRSSLRCLCAGCASGEEVYTLKILAQQQQREDSLALPVEIVATDIDAEMLQRAERGTYSKSSLKTLPREWLEEAFDQEDDTFRVKDRFRDRILWLRQDIQEEMPPGPFDLVLCRNLVFTYLDLPLQRDILDRLSSVLREGGALVIGKQESLPEGTPHFYPWLNSLRVYRRQMAAEHWPVAPDGPMQSKRQKRGAGS